MKDIEVTSKKLRPFFPYYGSKWGMARHMPPPRHERVVECFAGAAGYSTYWGSRNVTLVDTDPIIAGLWDYLIHADAERILELPNLPNAGDSVEGYQLLDAEKWLIGFWLNRGSATPKKTRTAYSARSDKGQLNWGEKAKARIVGQLDAIRDWKVVNKSFDSVDISASTWVIDPPYEDKGRYYRHSFSDYEGLAKFARRLPGQVMVSENEGATWMDFSPLGDFKATRGRTKEVIWIGGN